MNRTAVVALRKVQSGSFGSGLDLISLDLTDEDFAEGTLLLRKCAESDIEAVCAALAKKPQLVKFSDYDRRTALHVAASEGHLQLVTTLLDHRANPSRSDRWGGSPLDDSLRQRHQEVAVVLRAAGARLGKGDHGAALIAAASCGDSAHVQSLIEDGADPNSTDYDARTPIHLAASEGMEGVVAVLLQGGADPSRTDRWGGTPLDDAERKGHGECARLIREAGGTRGATGLTAARTHTAPAAAALNSVDWADIEVVEKIGSGAFGDIYKCRWRGTLVAAKTIKPDESLHAGDAAGGATPREEALADFRREIAILGQLRHPNICLWLGSSMTALHEVMISELMRCSLLDVLKASSVAGTPFAVHRTARYAIQFAQGMNYLHTCEPPVLHRDLKPANLLLDFSDVLKVSDFGLAKLRTNPAPTDAPDGSSHPTAPWLTKGGDASEYRPYLMTGETGSYRYMAPEVFRHEPYGRPVDVYSFAMILYYMLDGAPPWAHLDGVKAADGAARLNWRPEVPRHWDDGLGRLLRAAWAAGPAERPSFAAVLDTLHEFYKHEFKRPYDGLSGEPMAPSSAGCCAIM